MKPLYGTVEHVSWLGLEDGSTWSTWTCDSCDHKQTGSIIRSCENCGTYPKWEYNCAMVTVVKTYIKARTIRLISYAIYYLKVLKNKLDDQGIE